MSGKYGSRCVQLDAMYVTKGGEKYIPSKITVRLKRIDAIEFSEFDDGYSVVIIHMKNDALLTFGALAMDEPEVWQVPSVEDTPAKMSVVGAQFVSNVPNVEMPAHVVAKEKAATAADDDSLDITSGYFIARTEQVKDIVALLMPDDN